MDKIIGMGNALVDVLVKLMTILCWESYICPKEACS